MWLGSDGLPADDEEQLVREFLEQEAVAPLRWAPELQPAAAPPADALSGAQASGES
jgi:hypothetical protein